MHRIVCLFLLALNGVCFANRLEPLNYWNYPPEKVKEYKRNGRTCGDCHFPFTYNSRTYYGCFKKQESDEEYVCQTKSEELIPCPEYCPKGTVVYRYLKQEAGPNGTLQILCHGIGSPNPTAYWKKNGEVVEVVPPPEDPYLSALTFRITLKYQREDYGSYSCLLKNHYSSEDSAPPGESFPETFDFRGQILPFAPTNLQVKLKDTHANITWDYDGPDEKRGYKIYVNPGYQEDKEVDYQYYGHRHYAMRHLNPGVTYTFRLKAENNIGLGPMSDTLSFTIPPDAKIDKPVNVTVTNVTSTTVSLEWDFDGNMDEESWLFFAVLAVPGTYRKNESRESASQKHFIKIYNLEPFTNYKFTVLSVSVPGNERYAEPVYVRTPPSEPWVESVSIDERNDFVMKFSCTVSGRPEPSVFWTVDDAPLPDTVNPKVTTDKNGLVTSTFMLPRLDSNYQTYQCNGENMAGDSQRGLWLKYDKPEDKYIPETMDQFMMNMAKVLSEVKKELKQLQEEHEKLKNNVENNTTPAD